MFADQKDNFPNSDTIMRDCFMLGAHHRLTCDDVDYMCAILKEYYPGIMDKPESERPNSKFPKPASARTIPECQVVMNADGQPIRRMLQPCVNPNQRFGTSPLHGVNHDVPGISLSSHRVKIVAIFCPFHSDDHNLDQIPHTQTLKINE